jgi:hypothetical protein
MIFATAVRLCLVPVIQGNVGEFKRNGGISSTLRTLSSSDRTLFERQLSVRSARSVT